MNPYSPPGAVPDTYPAAPPPYAALDATPVSEATVEILRGTRPWVVLLSVLAFIGSGLMAAVGLIAAAFSMLAPGAKGSAALLGLVYFPIAAVYVYPGIKLWGYGAAIARLTATRTSADLEDALRQQKSFWKFSGIASLALLALYAVTMVVLVAFGALTALGMGDFGR